jgi:hypothetical protein
MADLSTLMTETKAASANSYASVCGFLQPTKNDIGCLTPIQSVPREQAEPVQNSRGVAISPPIALGNVVA